MYLSVVLIGVTIVLALMYYDIRYYRLPNLLTATFAFVGLLHTQLVAPEEIVTHLLAGLIGFASFTLISLFYRRFRKREGLGMGDAKFFAGIGLWLGGYSLAPVILVASMSALIVVLSLGITHKPVHRQSRVPFGFFLGIGFVIVFYLDHSTSLDLV